MTANFELHPNVGDHRLVSIPTALTSVTFNMASQLSSSSDTGTNKYFDNVAKTVIQFDVVGDKDIQITAFNGTSLTEAIPVNGNAVYQEDKGFYNNVTIKTTVDNTVISLRVR